MNQINQTTLKQIGGPGALFMMGCKKKQSYIDDEKNTICLRIGGNCKRVSYINIHYNSLDLYDIEYYKLWKGEKKLISRHEGLYNDMIKNNIEQNTGMYLTVPMVKFIEKDGK